jgi:hypothetical protein
LFISTEVTSVKIHESFRRDENENGILQTWSIELQLVASEKETLELATGEIFASPQSLSVEKKKNLRIDFLLNIYCASGGEDYKFNRLHYFEARNRDFESSDSSINGIFFLPEKLFSSVMDNVRSGVFPKGVTVGIETKLGDNDSPIRFGNMPDGSELIWNNKGKGNEVLPIDTVSLYFEPMPEIELTSNSNFFKRDELKPSSAVATEILRALYVANFLLVLILVALWRVYSR